MKSVLDFVYFVKYKHIACSTDLWNDWVEGVEPELVDKLIDVHPQDIIAEVRGTLFAATVYHL